MTRSGGAGRAKPPAARAKPPKTKTNEGRWTDEEHRKFLEAYEAMVAVDPARRRWPNVAAAVGVEINECRAGIASMARIRCERRQGLSTQAAVGTRSTTQCRSHAQKYFNVRKSNVRASKPKTPRARTPSTLALRRGRQNSR
mmetsp:Transcript_2007/g.5591  ORF Transcript_2007/g.5591 Transcript_2007/m.5591 type:complete len:142 (-) Transcript_2007:459-884(-)